MATKKKSSTINVSADTVNVRGGSEGPSPSKPYVEPIDRKSGWDQWDLKNFLRTLADAGKIRKNPHLMRALRAEAQKQMDALKATTTNLGK